MSVAPLSPTARRRVTQGSRLVLQGVPWTEYQRVLRAFRQRHLRITYDRGMLELLTFPPRHDRCKSVLRMLVEALLETLAWDWAGFGSMTHQRRGRRRGLEPDECFWIQNELLVRCKDHIDLRRDPPPDLALEIEISRSVLDRLGIYAALKVPEVWRSDGQTIIVHLLQADDTYAESAASRAFPFLPMAEMSRFLQQRATLGNAQLLAAFKDWVRDQIAHNWQPPTP